MRQLPQRLKLFHEIYWTGYILLTIHTAMIFHQRRPDQLLGSKVKFPE